MLANPMDVLHRFPVRKSGKQKQDFRDAVQSYGEKLGYQAAVEKGSLGCRNVIFGDPEKADFLVTAHYDTCAVLPFPNFLTPCNFWVFLLCQIGQWLGFLLLGVIAGTAAGLALGDAWIAPVSAGAVFAAVGLMLFGPANRQNANDNTSGVVTLLEIMRTLPENRRHKVCFVLFDLEEAGLIGSTSYRKAHKKATDTQTVLNLDCVGDGDHIRLFPTKKLLKNRRRCTGLYKACGYFGKKEILVHEKGFYVYPSDQMPFPWGVGICALQKGKTGLYVSRIHTNRDTVLDVNNVNLLRAALTTYLCCGD